MKKKPALSMKIKMESELTEPEMDAALQLIQLSGDSVENTAAAVEPRPEESIGESNEISSNVNKVVVGALLRRRKRFRLIADIYRATAPSVNNNKRGKKSVK